MANILRIPGAATKTPTTPVARAMAVKLKLRRSVPTSTLLPPLRRATRAGPTMADVTASLKGRPRLCRSGVEGTA